MPPALQFLVLTFAGWVNRHQDDLIAYLREEHRGLLAWRLGRARGVLVFGRVGPPRCHVCHDRGPARTLGLDATCGAQTGGVRPPPPGSRAYGVPLRGGASHEAKG